MLTELNGKAGSVCEAAKQGKYRCPLIVRQTSEDVVTAEIFETLEAINPRMWLPDFLNGALGAERFRSGIFRKLKIELWEKQSTFPPGMIPWKEGHTEVDVVISWQNPRTTVFVEMKYAAPLSPGTTHNQGTGKFPSDQLIRNARVGLHRCGWFMDDQLFDRPTSDFALILMAPTIGNPLVPRYRNEFRLRESIPRSNRIKRLPDAPFIGEIGYHGLIEILRERRRYLSACERRLSDRLVEYLQFKLQSKPQLSDRPLQYSLPLVTNVGAV